MTIESVSVNDYINKCPQNRIEKLKKLRQTILSNLPSGFEEVIQYKMPSIVVPKSIFPAGYHCDPKLPLPFLSFASQKNFIAVYHMGIYADMKLYEWFKNEWSKVVPYKLDIGKSCMRFKDTQEIPYDLIGKLIEKITPEQYIKYYQDNFLKKK